ncbi:hypothetical protein [Bacillus sp. 165]|uniref:hypothetical protein n=1 Tax=Bacillus sp. 165 TaxID=1529117 RepID=UPI001AD97559|nr:hypothetical protein [Bacillus sp. 165]MBO9130791.1 hypothetical protein [Bacillus sp. 165]
MEQTGFYWVGLIFWLLISSGLILLVWGLWKKSWKSLLMSGIALILPTLYFGGAETWFRLLAFFPLIPFVLAYIIKRKISVK